MIDVWSRFDAISQYEDNWDGENASKPTRAVIERAKLFLNWALQNNIDIADIDVDVMGGIAVYMFSKQNRRELRLSIKNSNHNTLVASINDIVVWSKMYTDDLRNEILTFLEIL